MSEALLSISNAQRTNTSDEKDLDDVWMRFLLSSLFSV